MKVTLIDRYFYIWALFLPVTSILIFPHIQGTTPAYILSFCSIALVFIISRKSKEYIKDFSFFLYGFMLLTFCSQLAISLSPRIFDFENIITISEGTKSIFRPSLITQSLYLFAAVSLFIFVKHFYKPQWMRYFFIGSLLLAIYGVYEVVYFYFFHSDGDFLSNRMFNTDYSGSVFQTMRIGSLTLLRLTSLTGEPSMYALTILPYWIYAIHKNKQFTQLFLLATLLLSTSTSALIGIFVYLILRLYYFKLKDKVVWFLLPLSILVLLVYNKVIIMSFNQLIWDKLTLNSLSGNQRFEYFTSHVNFFLNQMNVLNKLFGMGFGTVRSTDLFSTLLVNTGIIGIIAFTVLFFYPVFKLPKTYENIGLKSILICVYIVMMISIPEFSYLPTWLFLGIAYNKISKHLYTGHQPTSSLLPVG